MSTTESPCVEASSCPDDPLQTQIWEEEFWGGALDLVLEGPLQEKLGAAGALLFDSPDGTAMLDPPFEPGERAILIEQLVRVNRRLQRRSREQHERLEQQSRRLAAVNRAKDLLLSRTGHDLRNGIGSILAHTALAWAAGGGAGGEQLDCIEETCQHLLQLLDGLVDQAALASGVFTLRPISFALEDLVSSIARDLGEGPLAQKGQRPVIPDRTEAHVVHADPRRITQVLRNYLENASKFSQPGTTVELRFQATKSFVLVEVLDEGPGIPESALSALFDPMAVIGNVPTVGEPSTGLGLPVVADIVHRHGGEVWGRNRPGGGAVFGFSLPAITDSNEDPITWSMA